MKEDWDRRKIEDYWDGDNYWVTPAELDGSKYIDKTVRCITTKAVEKTNLTLMPSGTVLLSSRAPIGKVCITKASMYCNQGFKNLVCKELLYNEFAYYFLKHNVDYLQSLGTGATFKEISKKVVENVVIPIPPLSEQQHIVEELDLLSSIIEKKKVQLNELDNLAQSLFYEMFGDPITNEKGWKTSTFKKEFEISSGGTPSTSKREYWDNGNISWIGSNMCQNKVLSDNDGKYITHEGLEHSSAKLYHKGFVLVALVGATIGKCALLNFDTTTNQNIAGINVPSNKDFEPYYVFFTLQSLYSLFLHIGEGKFKMANLSFVRSLPIIKPPITLQQQFASKIETIEHQKELIKHSIKEVETLFNSRMDYYFN
jgi:type I restriction enzyme S subunit